MSNVSVKFQKNSRGCVLLNISVLIPDPGSTIKKHQNCSFFVEILRANPMTTITLLDYQTSYFSQPLHLLPLLSEVKSSTILSTLLLLPIDSVVDCETA